MNHDHDGGPCARSTKVSRPREFHPKPLAEPYVTLSCYTAPIVRTAIRNTYGQLAHTTIKTFLHWLPDRIFGTFNEGDHVYKLYQLDDLELEILFRALDRPEHVANLLSLELTGAWVNEARECRGP
jgi:hypothetical protein